MLSMPDKCNIFQFGVILALFGNIHQLFAPLSCDSLCPVCLATPPTGHHSLYASSPNILLSWASKNLSFLPFAILHISSACAQQLGQEETTHTRIDTQTVYQNMTTLNINCTMAHIYTYTHTHRFKSSSKFTNTEHQLCIFFQVSNISWPFYTSCHCALHLPLFIIVKTNLPAYCSVLTSIASQKSIQKLTIFYIIIPKCTSYFNHVMISQCSTISHGEVHMSVFIIKPYIKLQG